MNKEEVSRVPPAPPRFLGFKRYKNKDKEEVPRTHVALPFLRFKQYLHQNSKKIDKEEVRQTPPTPRASSTYLSPPPRQAHRWFDWKRYYNKKMNKEEVPPPPPPPPPPPNNIIEKEIALPPHNPPPPPPPPFIEQSIKNVDEELHRPPPPPTPRLNASARLALRQYYKQSSRKKIPRPPPPPLYHNQKPIEKPICLLSHPTLLHNLSRKPGGNTKSECYSCGERKSFIKDHTFHHYCKTCEVEFHHGCHKFPRKITHPYHPQHPLTFTFRNFETGIISDGVIDESFCNTVLSHSYMSGASTSEPEKSDIVFDMCKWCGRNIEGSWFYRCSICNFTLDLSCSQSFPHLSVANPKGHDHSLVFYPRPLLTPCDACGLVNVLEPSYACFECNYMVHQSCIDLPRVIKITRHQHRLSYSPYLQSTTSSCGICYKTVDTTYGQYSCSHKDCSYVVHSRCATDEKVWDGKELDQEPKESDEAESPFEKVDSDMIKHFSHEHLLKLEEYNGVRDAEKQCQACILPIDSGDFYNCKQCDFFLHKVCASLPRILDHALHDHPLSLDPFPRQKYNNIGCSVCSRKSTGFMYKCPKENCVLLKVQIDVRCILVTDHSYTHKAHEHLLFISSKSNGVKRKIWCKGCKKLCLESYLQCTECKFAMCYHCTTIPVQVRYEDDKHPLSLCYGDEANGVYWCEVCEKEVNPMDWFYKCHECSTTIHIQCVFGSSAYMKPGTTLYHSLTKMEICRNNDSTRPLCTQCGQRCPNTVYYKFGWLGRSTFCSLDCFAAKGKPIML